MALQRRDTDANASRALWESAVTKVCVAKIYFLILQDPELKITEKNAQHKFLRQN